MATPTQTQAHAALRESILGQKVTIPSIYETFPDWKPRVHHDYQRTRDEVLNPWIQKLVIESARDHLSLWVIDKRTARTLQTADFAIFAAVWCPDAPFDILCTAAKYFAWFFVYDDIFDCGVLKYNEALASNYRAATLLYFKYSLLGEGKMPDLACFDIDLRNSLQSWDEIREHICQVCSICKPQSNALTEYGFNYSADSSEATREVLCDEMLRYVGSVNNVDSIFAVHEVPTIEQYWERREATAGAHCVIATLPAMADWVRFLYGVEVDRTDLQDQSMRDLWRHTSYFVHMLNDGQIENLIPVLMLNDQIDCNTAMTQAYQLLHKEAASFREAGAHLGELPQQRSTIISNIFMEGCLNVAMGLVHWRWGSILHISENLTDKVSSYLSNRYFKPWEREENNVIKLTLGPLKLQEKVVGQVECSKTSMDDTSLSQSSLKHALLSIVPFSPLIMLTIVTIVPRLRALFPPGAA
ncbi:hypothetical protein N7493_007398 [Penicillium malachiteum]|uniref:Terpene synthase n=1 Tax=Penicillium malachiteum TaxID=1324776 RepID=A0AAD6MTW7_9EURO|nr:hypothetical protein N7493_007398 [Penicillium malachiteum]